MLLEGKRGEWRDTEWGSIGVGYCQIAHQGIINAVQVEGTIAGVRYSDCVVDNIAWFRNFRIRGLGNLDLGPEHGGTNFVFAPGRIVEAGLQVTVCVAVDGDGRNARSDIYAVVQDGMICRRERPIPG